MHISVTIIHKPHPVVRNSKPIIYEHAILQFQTAAVVNKANRLLGLIKKCFVNISIESFIILCKSLVHPYREYGNVIWGSFHVSDRIKLARKCPKESHQDGHYNKSFELL